MQLSTKEKANLAESQVIKYYKDCVCELEEKNRVLESEIFILKDLNMQYSSDSSNLRTRVGQLEAQVKELERAAKESQEKYEKAQQIMEDATAYERKKLEEEYAREKLILTEELRLNEVINK